MATWAGSTSGNVHRFLYTELSPKISPLERSEKDFVLPKRNSGSETRAADPQLSKIQFPIKDIIVKYVSAWRLILLILALND
jgi:hypothetical protein